WPEAPACRGRRASKQRQGVREGRGRAAAHRRADVDPRLRDRGRPAPIHQLARPLAAAPAGEGALRGIAGLLSLRRRVLVRRAAGLLGVRRRQVRAMRAVRTFLSPRSAALLVGLACAPVTSGCTVTTSGRGAVVDPIEQLVQSGSKVDYAIAETKQMIQ